MSPAIPEGGNRETVYPVVSDTLVPGESARAVCAGDPFLTENTAALRADMIAIQSEWLGVIETALRHLEHRGIHDPALFEAAAVAEQLRDMIKSPGAKMTTAAFWVSLYGCISIPFLKHFSSAIGDDLGHETAHKVIQVLSQLSQYLKL